MRGLEEGAHVRYRHGDEPVAEGVVEAVFDDGLIQVWLTDEGVLVDAVAEDLEVLA